MEIQESQKPSTRPKGMSCRRNIHQVLHLGHRKVPPLVRPQTPHHQTPNQKLKMALGAQKRPRPLAPPRPQLHPQNPLINRERTMEIHLERYSQFRKSMLEIPHSRPPETHLGNRKVDWTNHSQDPPRHCASLNMDRQRSPLYREDVLESYPQTGFSACHCAFGDRGFLSEFVAEGYLERCP